MMTAADPTLTTPAAGTGGAALCFVPEGDLVPLAECPIGLFLFDGDTLCLKTEYATNEGRIDAFIVSTGEFFWGMSPQTIASQRAQVVQPVVLRKEPHDAAE